VSRLRRFLAIGAPAKQEPAAPPPTGATADRFQAAHGETVAEVDATASRSGASVDRFAPHRLALALASDDLDEQPFVRCVRCRAENHRHLTTCQVCGSEFGTPEQRHYNEQVYGEWRAQQRAAAERKEAERLERERELAEERERRQRLAAERERLDTARGQIEEMRRQVREWPPSLGLVLLRKIRNPWLRLAVLATIFLLLVQVARSPDPPISPWVMAFGIALVFLPWIDPRRFFDRRG